MDLLRQCISVQHSHMQSDTITVLLFFIHLLHVKLILHIATVFFEAQCGAQAMKLH